MAEPPSEAGAVQVTVTEPLALAVAVPMVGAPGAVDAAVMVVVASGTGLAGGMGDDELVAEDGRGVDPSGQPCTDSDAEFPSTVMFAVVSNSLISATNEVPTAPVALRVVVMVGNVTVYVAR